MGSAAVLAGAGWSSRPVWTVVDGGAWPPRASAHTMAHITAHMNGLARSRRKAWPRAGRAHGTEPAEKTRTQMFFHGDGSRGLGVVWQLPAELRRTVS